MLALLVACWSGTPAIAYRTRVRVVRVPTPCLDVWHQAPPFLRTPCDGLDENECDAVHEGDKSFHRAELLLWSEMVWKRCSLLDELP